MGYDQGLHILDSVGRCLDEKVYLFFKSERKLHWSMQFNFTFSCICLPEDYCFRTGSELCVLGLHNETAKDCILLDFRVRH